MIIPAILETEYSKVLEKIEILEHYTPVFQIDIADGKLVGGKTFLTPKLLDQIETETTFELDLMVENPQDFVKERIVSVLKVCANIKAIDNIPDFIQNARNQDYLTGISINPDTPLELIEPLLTEIDYVQFMGVIPGKQGNSFDNRVISKVKEFKEKYPHIEIQIDGGVNEGTILKLLDLDIKNFVVGSAIFNSEDPIESYIKLKETAHDQTDNLFSIAK